MATGYNPFTPPPTPGVSTGTSQYPQPIGPSIYGGNVTDYPTQSGTGYATPFDYARGVFGAAAQPSLAANQIDQNAYTRNIGYAIQNQGISADLLRAQYAQSGGDNSAALASNAINLEAAKRQIPLISQLTGIEQGALERQPELLMTLLNSDVVKMGIQREQANTTAADSTRNLNYDATAKGSYGSVGANLQRASIQDQLHQQLGLIDQNEVQARAQAREAYATILDKLGTLKLTSNESLANAQDKINLLNIEADRLGTTSGALASQLQAGLNKLGLSTAMNVDTLLDNLAKGDLNAQTIYFNSLQAAGQWATAFESTRP